MTVIEAASVYIPMDRRQAMARGQVLPERVQGAALFADISGFTPLTEALAAELGPQRGAEELARHLNLVYDALIAELENSGGSVIGFSGDAITCWLDGDDGAQAVVCAQAMQKAMQRFATVTTASGKQVSLAVKVAVAVGPARRFLVGDPAVQLIDVLSGATLDNLAAAEHHAGRGEIVVDPATLAALAGRISVSELRGGDGTAPAFGVVSAAPFAAPVHALAAAGQRRTFRAAVPRVAAARGVRAAAVRLRRIPGRAAPGGRAFHALRRAGLRRRRRSGRQARCLYPGGAAHPQHLRRYADPAHARRQGQLSVCRIRRAGRPRG